MSGFLKVAGEVRSLAWDGDELVDALAGGRRWTLDGTEFPAGIRWGSLFDRATSHGEYSVLYAAYGTKALLVKGDELIRELDRSYYNAEVYEYPVALGTLPDGRDVLVHCPDEYNLLEVEEVESGRRITVGERAPEDVFHSQLRVSPDGRRVLSVGWVWHPVGVAQVFELPGPLDGDGVLPLALAHDADIVAGCWLDADRVVVAAGEDLGGAEDDAAVLGPRQFGVWSYAESAWVHRHRTEYVLGWVLGQGNCLVSLSGHPRVLSVRTGELLAEWPDIPLPERVASYGFDVEPAPVAALDPTGKRLAIAVDGGIRVLEIPDSA
ncbi:hypothetical protein [Kribbella sp. NPDC051770]|uniref:hypothetical protein n=1 Tax=Kribbella sp. NPDC051770 TaxID=3155413 RepID=UPI00341F6BFF